MGSVLHAIPAAAGIPFRTTVEDCVSPQELWHQGPVMVIYASEAIGAFGQVDHQRRQKPLVRYRSTRLTNQERLVPKNKDLLNGPTGACA